MHQLLILENDVRRDNNKRTFFQFLHPEQIPYFRTICFFVLCPLRLSSIPHPSPATNVDMDFWDTLSALFPFLIPISILGLQIEVGSQQ